MQKRLLAALLATLAVGCASTARVKALERSLNEYLYEQPPAEILSAAKELMIQKHGLQATAINPSTLESDSTTTAVFTQQLNISTTTNYRVEAVPVSGGTRVTITKRDFTVTAQKVGAVAVGSGGPSYERDYELELELLRKLAEPKAKQIDDAATAAK